jgi:hypothetical protein
MPPIAIPNRARAAKNSPYVLQNPVANSNIIRRTQSATNGYFRLYLSASPPKMIPPSGRDIIASVMARVIGSSVLSKVVSKSGRLRVTEWKSKASQLQAKKPSYARY